MPASSGAWTAVIWRADSSSLASPVVLDGGDAPQNLDWFFTPPDPDGCLVVPPDGLGLPGLRSGDIVPAQRDGVRMTGDWYGPRVVTLTVEVTTEDCPSCPTIREKVRDLQKKLVRFVPLAAGTITDWAHYMLLFPPCYDFENVCTQDQDWSGPYMLFGRVRAVDVQWQPSNERRAIVLIRFDAYDHRLMLPCYDESNPYQWVPSQCVEVNETVDITVRESQCVHLSFELEGPFTTGTEIEVTFEGEVFSYTIQTDIPMGETWNIDGVNKSLLRAGLAQSTNLGFIGSPGPVGPGTVTVTVFLGDPGDTGTVTVCWEDSVVGA